MRVIALASHKGGTGKTTLAGHLAVQAQRAGAGPVVVVDTDHLGTLVDWWDARPHADIAFVESHMGRLASDLAALREDGFRLAFIDTPSANPIAIQTAMQQADLVVVPVRIGPHDLKAVGSMLDLSDRVGKPIAFLMNAVPALNGSAEDVGAALARHGSVLPCWVGQHSDLAQAMAAGLTIMECDPDSSASQDFELIWEQICQRADKNFRKTVFAAPGSLGFAAVVRPGPIGFGRRHIG